MLKHSSWLFIGVGCLNLAKLGSLFDALKDGNLLGGLSRWCFLGKASRLIKQFPGETLSPCNAAIRNEVSSDAEFIRKQIWTQILQSAWKSRAIFEKLKLLPESLSGTFTTLSNFFFCGFRFFISIPKCDQYVFFKKHIAVCK